MNTLEYAGRHRNPEQNGAPWDYCPRGGRRCPGCAHAYHRGVGNPSYVARHRRFLPMVMNTRTMQLEPRGSALAPPPPPAVAPEPAPVQLRQKGRPSQ